LSLVSCKIIQSKQEKQVLFEFLVIYFSPEI